MLTLPATMWTRTFVVCDNCCIRSRQYLNGCNKACCIYFGSKTNNKTIGPTGGSGHLENFPFTNHFRRPTPVDKYLNWPLDIRRFICTRFKTAHRCTPVGLFACNRDDFQQKRTERFGRIMILRLNKVFNLSDRCGRTFARNQKCAIGRGRQRWSRLRTRTGLIAAAHRIPANNLVRARIDRLPRNTLNRLQLNVSGTRRQTINIKLLRTIYVSTHSPMDQRFYMRFFFEFLRRACSFYFSFARSIDDVQKNVVDWKCCSSRCTIKFDRVLFTGPRFNRLRLSDGELHTLFSKSKKKKQQDKYCRTQRPPLFLLTLKIKDKIYILFRYCLARRRCTRHPLSETITYELHTTIARHCRKIANRSRRGRVV